MQEDLPLFSRAIINPVVSVDLLAVCVNGSKASMLGEKMTTKESIVDFLRVC
jgi:hypothetical protein